MKATIEFDDHLYRRLKATAALRGNTVKELVTEGVRRILDESPQNEAQSEDSGVPDAWFGALRAYAGNARGPHSLQAMRRSVARGRSDKAQSE